MVSVVFHEAMMATLKPWRWQFRCKTSGYFGVSDVGKCVLLDSPACAEEACPLAVMVRGVDLPCGILLRDGAQRVSAGAVHRYHRLAGHRWRRKQWLRPHRRSGTNKQLHKQFLQANTASYKEDLNCWFFTTTNSLHKRRNLERQSCNWTHQPISVRCYMNVDFGMNGHRTQRKLESFWHNFPQRRSRGLNIIANCFTGMCTDASSLRLVIMTTTLLTIGNCWLDVIPVNKFLKYVRWTQISERNLWMLWHIFPTVKKPGV